jgi:hypothetical protein
MAKKQSTLDFFIRNANESNEPAQAYMVNDAMTLKVTLFSTKLYQKKLKWCLLNLEREKE